MSANLTNAIKALEFTITPSNKTIIKGMIAQLKQMRDLVRFEEVARAPPVMDKAPTHDQIASARSVAREQILEFCCNAKVNAIVAIASSDCTEINAVALSNHETSASTREAVKLALSTMITGLVDEDRREGMRDFCAHFDLESKMRRCIAFHKMQWAPIDIDHVEASHTISAGVDAYVQTLRV
jgi:hypothetical protein